MIAIGTIASELRKKSNQKIFLDWIIKFIKLKRPKSIIIYGFLPNEIKRVILDLNTGIYVYEAKTNKDLKRWKNEQGK